MPELPEVETVRRTLLPMVGDTIAAVQVRERRLRSPISTDFEHRLVGSTVTDIDRRGKYLLFRLSSGECVLAHLGMSGSMVLQPTGAERQRHDHVVMTLASGRELVFNDPRRFGLLKLGKVETFAELQRVGRDSLAELPSANVLKELCERRRKPIKNLLMDQQLLGGIGNIYANEILFHAGVRPRRQAAGLSRRELERVATAIAAVLSDAVRLGGSSISDYRDGTGKPGYFQIEHRVYDRGGQPCRSCGTSIRRLVLVGRSTFYCPRCQQ